MITCARITISWMIGFSANSGKVAIALMRVLTSSRTSRESASASSSIVTAPTPSVAEEVTRFTPSIECTSSSMRTQIASSTSSGAAPG